MARRRDLTRKRNSRIIDAINELVNKGVSVDSACTTLETTFSLSRCTLKTIYYTFIEGEVEHGTNQTR